MTTTTVHTNPEFAHLASDAQIERAAKALESNGFQIVVVENAAKAKEKVLALLPEGAEVFSSQSRTLAETGIAEAIDLSGRYDAVRPRMHALDYKTQRDEIRKLTAAPAYIVGSVHALTEDGHALIASASGSQLGPYAASAGKVVWVVGAQKIVPSISEGMRRIQEYSYPLEDERLRQAYGMPSFVGKVLLFSKEAQSGRTTIVIVKEKLGF